MNPVRFLLQNQKSRLSYHKVIGASKNGASKNVHACHQMSTNYQTKKLAAK
jgi:hypothetical protein